MENIVRSLNFRASLRFRWRAQAGRRLAQAAIFQPFLSLPSSVISNPRALQ